MSDPTPSRIGTVILAVLLACVLLGAVVFQKRQRNTPPVPEVESRSVLSSPFTTVPPDTTPIEWRTWSDDTFETARELGRPIAALMDAAWCESCVLYAGALAANPRARRALENGVIPVRVDIDRRPDVHIRHHIHVSSLPTWILLSPSGELWDLHEALGFEALARTLEDLRRNPDALAPDPGLDWLATSLPTTPAVSQLEELPKRILDDLLAAWPAPDELVKPESVILQWDVLGFLHAFAERTGSEQARSLYLDTLRSISSRLDPETGAVEQVLEAEPGRITRGRFLGTHAMLLLHFDRARSMSRDEVFARSARSIASFLGNTLFEPTTGLFRAAQGTLFLREGRPALTSLEREKMLRSGHATLPVPDPIPVFPIPGNARACVAFLRHARTHENDTTYRAQAAQVLDRLRSIVGEEGRVPHDLVRDSRGTLRASERDFLIDYAELGLAFLEEHRTGLSRGDALFLAETRALADTLLARFGDPERGIFYDIPDTETATAPARMRIRMAPLTDNARTALFLVELARVTRDARYERAAFRALEAWSGSAATEDPWSAAGYGRALLAALERRTP